MFFIQISAFYPFLFKGRGVLPPLFRDLLCQPRIELARHMIECPSGVPANIDAGDFAG